MNNKELLTRKAYEIAVSKGLKIDFKTFRIGFLAFLQNHKEADEADPLINDSVQFTKGVKKNKANGMLPPTPKKGEIMYCRHCNKPMLPNTKSFNKNKIIRKSEFKWQICDECYMTFLNTCDRNTKGLELERGIK